MMLEKMLMIQKLKEKKFEDVEVSRIEVEEFFNTVQRQSGSNSGKSQTVSYFENTGSI